MHHQALLISALLMTSGLGLSCQRPAGGGPTGAAAKVPAEARVLRFGSGGGFAGTVTTYSLTPTGQFERRSGRATVAAPPVTPLNAPPAGQVARCFQLFDSLPADSLMLAQPGNVYYFLQGQTAGGQAVSITWGAPGVQAPHAARVLYQELMGLVK